MGGVESAFQFLGYKVDQVDLKLQQSVPVVLYAEPVRPEQVIMKVRIRNPGRIASDRIYVGGLDTQIEIFGSGDHVTENRLLVTTLGIVGVFKTVDASLNPEIEDQLTRIQIPAILFPYLRAALTSVLTSAGFAGVILPLVNVQELAKNAKIEVTDLSRP